MPKIHVITYSYTKYIYVFLGFWKIVLHIHTIAHPTHSRQNVSWNDFPEDPKSFQNGPYNDHVHTEGSWAVSQMINPFMIIVWIQSMRVGPIMSSVGVNLAFLSPALSMIRFSFR